jgi:hypothetical protein
LPGRKVALLPAGRIGPGGLAAALILRAGRKQCLKADPRGRREAVDAAQGDDLGIPGRKASDSGEDCAYRLIGDEQIFRLGN